MRLDKWLKVSRLIKRRTIAQMACDQGRVFLNDRTAKPAAEVKVNDKLHIEFGSRALTVEILLVPTGAVAAQDADSLYQVISEIRRPQEVLSLDSLDDLS